MMNAKPFEQSRIDPVPASSHRPFWSVMIPTLNRPEYLEETLASVLMQDPGPAQMQIEVVDNCSTEGDSEAIVERVGRGRVSFSRQVNRVPVSANFNTCIRHARGHFVHILHDDDMVLPGFYDEYRAFIQAHPHVRMVCSRAMGIDDKGEPLWVMYGPPGQSSSGLIEDAFYKLVMTNWVICSTAAVDRVVYETLGGFSPSLSFAVDWEMWLRVAASSPIGYIHDPLFKYRYHSQSPGSGTLQTFLNDPVTEQMQSVVDFGAAQLPTYLQRKAQKQAYLAISEYATSIAAILHANGENRAALRYAYRAFKLCPCHRSFYYLVRTALWQSK